MVQCGRFLDLLDVALIDDQDNDALEDKENLVKVGIRQLKIHDQSHGPLNWSTQCSMELQRAADALNKDELCELQFSVTVADPSLADCPLVACSIGFTELTGYYVHEIVGRNCRLLLNGVPQNLVDEEVRFQCRSFCQSSKQGQEYDGRSDVLPQGVAKSWFSLPKGELVCIQTNASKSGELFRNMFYLKQVELDDAQYIVALQAGIPDECEDWSALHILQKKCHATWKQLDANMTAIEHALAAQFWYTAPMRRQHNCKPLDEIEKV